MRLNHLFLSPPPSHSLFRYKFSMYVHVDAFIEVRKPKYEKYESKSRNENAPNVLNIRLLFDINV